MKAANPTGLTHQLSKTPAVWGIVVCRVQLADVFSLPNVRGVIFFGENSDGWVIMGSSNLTFLHTFINANIDDLQSYPIIV